MKELITNTDIIYGHERSREGRVESRVLLVSEGWRLEREADLIRR